jgi:ferredoxin
MTASVRVEVIRERCLSTANCVATAPGFFDLDDDGIATVAGEAGASEEAEERGR